MIALIALIALAVVAGILVGVVALFIAIARAVVCMFRPGRMPEPGTNGRLHLSTIEDLEFQRIVEREWKP